MDLIFLGTASGYPSPRRGASGLILRDLKCGSQWLFDCGEGTQIQAQKSRLVHMGRISNIFISHLHGDHVYGLPGLLCTIAQRSEAGDINLASSEDATKKPCVNIYGPQGLRRFVRLALAISRTRMQYSYAVHELIMRKEHRPEGYEDWASLEVDPDRDPPLACELPGRSIYPDDDGFWINVTGGEKKDGTLVHAVALKHAVPSLGWLVIKPDHEPSLRVDVARSLGVPDGKLMGVLKQGKPVTVNGQTVRPEQVLGVPARGERVAIMGDSYDSQELERLVNRLVVQGTFPELALDVLVHEATLEHGMAESAREKGHSTPIQATSFAARLNVRLLILTHFSQRYNGIGRTDSVGSITDLSAEPDTVVPQKSAHKDRPSVQILLDEAKTIPFGGEIMLADDFAVIPVPTTKVKEPP